MEGVSGPALEAIVSCAYTGRLRLRGCSVVAIIQAANLLQVRGLLAVVASSAQQQYDGPFGAPTALRSRLACARQVEPVERAAAEFLQSRLDAGNVLSATALGEHLSAGGAAGRELRDAGRDWIFVHLGALAPEPSFLELPAAEVRTMLGHRRPCCAGRAPV